MARAPGPKNPGKYPAPVGQNYNRYGEQPGYVYNPYTDKYLPDPKVQGEYLQSQGLGEPKAPGLGETILPIAATAGALYGAQSLAPELVGSWKGEGSGLLGGIKDTLGFGSGSAQAADIAALDAAAAQAGAASGATGALPATPEMIGELTGRIPTTAAGSWYNTAPEMGSANQIVSGLAALHGGYNAFQDLQHGGSGRAGFTQAGAGVGNIIGGPVGGAIGAAYGNLMGYGLQGEGIKNHIALALTNPVFEFGRLLGFDVTHETTKQAQEKRWKGLADRGIAGAEEGYQAMHMVENPGVNPDGTKWKFTTALDEVKTTNPGQFRGVYGNFDVFGNDWIGYAPEQQDAIIQAIAKEGLYYSKKGDVLIKDADKAREIKDLVLSGGYQAPAEPATPAPNQQQLETNKPLPGGPRKPVRKGRKD